MARIVPCFPLADRRVIGGIVYVIRDGLPGKETSKDDGPHWTLYNRFIRWRRMGVSDRIFAGLAADGPGPKQILIDATHLRAHRTAASLLKKGLLSAASSGRRAA